MRPASGTTYIFGDHICFLVRLSLTNTYENVFRAGIANTISTTSYDDIRAQVRTNLKMCGHADVGRLEVITSSSMNHFTAWLVDGPSQYLYEAVMKGPPRATREEAFDALLQTSSGLVSKINPDLFMHFHAQRSFPVGDALVLRSFYDEMNATKYAR